MHVYNVSEDGLKAIVASAGGDVPVPSTPYK